MNGDSIEDRIKITILGALCILGLLTPASFLIGKSLGSKPQADSGKEQYSRGIFDVCIYINSQQATPVDATDECNQFSRTALDEGWYEQPSKGFVK